MSVLTIRAHKRYALRLPVTLEKKGAASATKPAEGLLIELSAQGARLSNLGKRRKYHVGQEVTVATPCGKQIKGSIRWAHDGLAGIALDSPLHLPQMSELLQASRNYVAEAQCYGTTASGQIRA